VPPPDHVRSFGRAPQSQPKAGLQDGAFTRTERLGAGVDAPGQALPAGRVLRAGLLVLDVLDRQRAGVPFIEADWRVVGQHSVQQPGVGIGKFDGGGVSLGLGSAEPRLQDAIMLGRSVPGAGPDRETGGCDRGEPRRCRRGGGEGDAKPLLAAGVKGAGRGGEGGADPRLRRSLDDLGAEARRREAVPTHAREVERAPGEHRARGDRAAVPGEDRGRSRMAT